MYLIKKLKEKNVNKFDIRQKLFYPEILIHKNDDKFRIGYFDYCFEALDGKVYVLEFLVALEEITLYITFSCPKEEEELKKIIRRIIRTIKII